MKKKAAVLFVLLLNLAGIACLVYFAVQFLSHDPTVRNPEAMIPFQDWEAGGMALTAGVILLLFAATSFVSMRVQTLRRVPEEAPYRGPRAYVNGDYAYSCSMEGSFDWFRGTETISYRGEQIYECCFHGGAIR